jgi:hypothetical protein
MVSPLSAAISPLVPSEKTLSYALLVVFWPCDEYTDVRYTADDTPPETQSVSSSRRSR